ncbi:DUF5659 domain-containing protein [Paenibacillus thailandensis]|uniref:DUF5659 domain-containing protein n=1 Tax=Paenibacillus thailandensis TaxID=393250 RepID=A0ABW5R317_9BACL
MEVRKLNKTITIHSPRMAGWLMFNGIMFLQCNQNLIDTNKKVFVFHNSDKVKSLMNVMSKK